MQVDDTRPDFRGICSNSKEYEGHLTKQLSRNRGFDTQVGNIDVAKAHLKSLRVGNSIFL